MSIFLIIGFRAQTESLIPLYAVGVFIPFTLSQTGMMVKWFKERPKMWIPKFIINTSGALICFGVSLMFFITKLAQVWPVFIFLPLIILIFHRIHKHYEAVGEQLRLTEDVSNSSVEGNVMIVPVAGLTRVVESSIRYAESLAPDKLMAVYVSFDRETEKEFQEKWQQRFPNVRLVTLYSQYRSIITPLTKFIDTVERQASKSNYQVTVVIPQFVTKKGWHHILHNQSGLMIRSVLLYKKNVVIATVPYHLMK